MCEGLKQSELLPSLPTHLVFFPHAPCCRALTLLLLHRTSHSHTQPLFSWPRMFFLQISSGISFAHSFAAFRSPPVILLYVAAPLPPAQHHPPPLLQSTGHPACLSLDFVIFYLLECKLRKVGTFDQCVLATYWEDSRNSINLC